MSDCDFIASTVQASSKKAHSKIFIDDIGNLLDGRFSDVKFLVNDEIFAAHRCILAARCPYFRALLFGNLRESRMGNDDVIEIKDISPDAFRSLLIYIYQGTIHHISKKVSTIIEMLTVSDRFGFKYLQESVSQMLQQRLNAQNVLATLERALLHNIEVLIEKCLLIIDQNSEEMSEALADLSEEALVHILKSDSFYVPEEKIISIIHEWHIKHNLLQKPIKTVLDCARLHLLSF